MLALEFPGCDRLLAMINEAVALGDDHAVTERLRNGLSDAIRNGTTTLIDHHASQTAIDGSLDAVA